MPLVGVAPYKLTTIPTIQGGFVTPPTVEPDTSFIASLYKREQERVLNCGKFWRAYHGNIEGDSADDPLNKWNFIRKVVDTHVYFLMGGGMTTKVKKPFVKRSLPIIRDIWESTGESKFLNAAGQTGSVTGDWFALTVYDEPTALERLIKPYSKGQIKHKLFGSEQVFCSWDPLDNSRLEAVRIETYFQSTGQSGDAGVAAQRHTMIITRTTISQQLQGEPPKITANILGEIPLVHCKNRELAGEPYGLSDVVDLLPLVTDLSEKTTDISNSINANGVPTIAMFGAKAKALDKEPSTFWSGLPEKARIDVIRLGQNDLGGANSYVQELKKTMYEISGVPEAVLGGQMAISNTSGVAIQMVYLPLTMSTWAKRVNAEPALARLNYFGLRYAAILGLWNPPYDMCECGGRIVEVETGNEIEQWDPALDTYVRVPERKRKCYLVDEQSFEFMSPRDVVVKALVNYGVGYHVGEFEFKDVKAKASEARKSFWYMATEAMTEAGSPVPTIPLGEFPKEPELVTVIHTYVSPNDGRFIKESREQKLLVPTGCCSPEYLDPYHTEVTLTDVTPKDDAVLAQFLSLAQDRGWVDREFCQDQFPKISAEKHAINARVKHEEEEQESEYNLPQQDMAPPDTSQKSVEGKAKAQQKQANGLE